MCKANKKSVAIRKAVCIVFYALLMSFCVKSSYDFYQSSRPIDVTLTVTDVYTSQYRGTITTNIEVCDDRSGLCKTMSVRRASDWVVGSKYAFHTQPPRENDCVIIVGAISASFIFAHVLCAVFMFFVWMAKSFDE